MCIKLSHGWPDSISCCNRSEDNRARNRNRNRNDGSGKQGHEGLLLTEGEVLRCGGVRLGDVIGLDDVIGLTNAKKNSRHSFRKQVFGALAWKYL